jgi:hypothetical protein
MLQAAALNKSNVYTKEPVITDFGKLDHISNGISKLDNNYEHGYYPLLSKKKGDIKYEDDDDGDGVKNLRAKVRL